jgi:imidazolonepropionase-like amidohydrolase
MPITRVVDIMLCLAILLPCLTQAQQATRTVEVDRGAMDPAVSPDGARIAASIFGKIWIVPFAGGEAVQVTRGIGWDGQPAWSPDGRFLAYAHQLPSGTSLVIRNLETGGANPIYHTDAGIGHIEFDPKGGGLYFVLEQHQYDAHLWRIATDGSESTQITHTENWHEWSFALSPSGDSVFLESGRYGGADLYMLRLENMGVERLTRTPANEFSVAWSRDGRRRVFVEGDDGIDRVMVQEANGEARQVFESSYDQKQIALHPDGNVAVLAAGRRLYQLDLPTGKNTSIPFQAVFHIPQPPTADLAIINAQLFDGIGDAITESATVLVRDGRIAEIRVGGGIAPPSDFPVIDAEGHTLLPGLIDNHYHYWAAHAGGPLLARGVTSIRDPGVAVSESMNYKEAINLGLLAGPSIYTTGPLIDGEHGYHPMVDVSLRTPAAAPALVRALKAQGVDALKAYFMLQPDVLRAVVEEARAQGLPVTGHIGVRTSWQEAMEAGINGFSHIRVWKDFLSPEQQPQGLDESLDGSRNPTARMQADWRDIDPDDPEVAALIRRMVETGTALDPTLRIQRIDKPSRSRFSLELYAAATQSYQRMGKFVRNAQQAGVLLLAGTDNINLFDELEAYADFGVPNAEIIRSATVNGARWLGKDDEFGTIQVGKRAHLLLVDGDPLEDIKQLRNVVLVVKDGVVVFRR